MHFFDYLEWNTARYGYVQNEFRLCAGLYTDVHTLDIGYAEAIGIFEYVDDRYVPSHSFGGGVIGKNQTFSVPAVDSIVQYAFDTDFKRIIDSGNFVYIDAHYCINDPKYMAQNEFGILEMTDYALNHMDECCLVFDRTMRPNTEYGARRYTECALFQNAVSQNLPDFKYNHTENNKEVEARAAAMRAELSEVKEAAQIKSQLPGSFGGSLVMLIKWRKLTNEQLAEKSWLSSKTIQRMRNEPDHKWDLETIAKVCLGLQLPPGISSDLIEKAGLSTKGGEKGFTYSHLLATQYKCTIFEFNEY
jgi:DNA-binding Xre family transcriptional regulator